MPSTTSENPLRSLARKLAAPLRRRVSVRPTARQLDGHALSEARLRLAGRQISILVREGTTDLDLVHMILCHDSEYRLPPQVHPRVIFDIGANIGVTAVYFSLMYPQAEIYCFEPLPQNLQLLEENVRRNNARVRAFNYGLADQSGHFDYLLSDDPRSFAGGTFAQVGGDASRILKLELRAMGAVLAELGVANVDVFKIDTEGCEWPIVQAIGESFRHQAQAFIGELHGNQDWALCQMLSATHGVGLNKRYDRRCCNFLAVRHDLLAGGQAFAPRQALATAQAA